MEEIRRVLPQNVVVLPIVKGEEEVLSRTMDHPNESSADLRQQLTFEKLLTNISSRLISLPVEEIDAGL